MKYGLGAAAHIGGQILVVTPSELATVLSPPGRRRVRVVQDVDSRGYGVLTFKISRRVVCEARTTTRGRLHIHGLSEPPWSGEDAALLLSIRRKLAQFLRYSNRPGQEVAWREVERKGVKVIEARRPGWVLGTIEPHGKRFAFFIKGKKIGRASASVSRLKQNAHLHMRENYGS